jgi:hypothetical protein
VRDRRAEVKGIKIMCDLKTKAHLREDIEWM